MITDKTQVDDSFSISVTRGVRIGDRSSLYLYEVSTDKGIIEVDANTRASARKVAENDGYLVHDVNMVG